MSLLTAFLLNLNIAKPNKTQFSFDKPSHASLAVQFKLSENIVTAINSTQF